MYRHFLLGHRNNFAQSSYVGKTPILNVLATLFRGVVLKPIYNKPERSIKISSFSNKYLCCALFQLSLPRGRREKNFIVILPGGKAFLMSPNEDIVHSS